MSAEYVVLSINPETGNSQVMREYVRSDKGQRQVVKGPWTKAEAEKIAQYLAIEEGIGDSKRFTPRLQFKAAQIDSSEQP